MTTKFTPSIASLTRDLENADHALSDRLAHCQRLAAENADLIEALKLFEDVAQWAIIPLEAAGYNETPKQLRDAITNARAIIAHTQE